MPFFSSEASGESRLKRSLTLVAPKVTGSNASWQDFCLRPSAKDQGIARVVVVVLVHQRLIPHLN